MALLDDYRSAGRSLYDRLHLSSYPVAIKYLKDIHEIPDGSIRPSSLGQKASVCQAYTYARRFGFSIAMIDEDNFCKAATVMLRWVDIPLDDIIESQVRQGWHKDAAAERKRMEHQLDGIGRDNLAKMKYTGFVCAPLMQTPVVPDTVLIYGNTQNITHIIHALCYEGKNFPTSSFDGFAESCLKGGLIPFISGIPQVVIPGMGEHSFAGVHESEIAIGMPAKLVFDVDRNLFLTGGQLLNMGQPVRTLIPQSLNESLTPGFDYLKEKIDEINRKKRP